MSTVLRILGLIALLYATEGIQKAVAQSVKQSRSVKAFDNVVLETSDKTLVQIREAKSPGMCIKADASLIDKVKTSIIGSTLIIHVDEKDLDAESIEIYIQLPVLKKLSLSGGGQVQIIDGNLGADFETSITGGGRIKFEEKMNVQKFYSRISGGGTVEALNLLAEEASIQIVGGGEVMLQVQETLDGKIIGGGNILYEGDPRVSSQITGGGRVASRSSWFPAL